MPNRLIKESICTSENIDRLTAFQETVFYRLIVNCDDYGRMDARPQVLSARLFPLKAIRAAQIKDALRALSSAELVTLYTVNGKPFVQMKTWERHQQIRAHKSKYPAPDDNCEQMISNDINCYQMISDDIKCSRNPIQSNPNPIQNPNPNPIQNPNPKDDDDDDIRARAIQSDHDRILTAAEDAGFRMGNTVRARLIDLYSEHGLEKVLEGISSCVNHGAVNLAYLAACVKGGPKKAARPADMLPAQSYEQRDWTGDQDDAIARMMDWNPEDDV